jgi:hypothetical protein
MPRHQRPLRTLRGVAVAAAIVSAATCTGCGVTHTPPQEAERTLKAAGVPVFEIFCSRDLWDETKGVTDSLSVSPQPDGLVEVQLSGPDMVDYLAQLDQNAHGGMGSYDPKSIAMYDAVAPVIDQIQPGTAKTISAPQIVVDAAIPRQSAPYASARASRPAP